jgi:transposase-like protein
MRSKNKRYSEEFKRQIIKEVEEVEYGIKNRPFGHLLS